MNVFLDFPLLSTFATIVSIFIIVKVVRTMSAASRHSGRDCANCGATMPWNAGYCRRCGTKLG